jgi:carbonic anhydrase
MNDITRKTLSVDELFQRNRDWAAAMVEKDAGFFSTLASQQSPEYLWIGCSDSRVPANELLGLAPGELFVHRNIANVVVHSDLNCLTVLQFAIHVQDVQQKHGRYLGDALPSKARANRLCELNVIEQVINTAQTTVVQDAWERGQELTVHGWVYGLQDGLLRDLGMAVSAADELAPQLEARMHAYDEAIAT